MNTVAIILVNWNGQSDTLACLASIQKLIHPGIRLVTFVVDNGSSDGSISAIKKQYPAVHVIDASQNRGFTGGNNLGIQEAIRQGADAVWLLNNDTVVDPHALTALYSTLQKEHVGIVGSKIYFTAGHEFHVDRYKKIERGNVLWYAGGLIDWANMYASHRGVDEVDNGQYDHLEETAFITGCSFMIKRSVIETVGLLDDRYFLYLEDLDYCLRAKAKGFSLVYVPSSKLWHNNASSSARPGNPMHTYYFTRNRILVGMKFAPLRTKLALLREAFRFLRGKDDLKRKAIIDILLFRFGKQYVWER